MKVSGNATAYDIKQFGYYKDGAVAPGFPDYKKLLSSFITWGGNVSQISNTKTYGEGSFTTKTATFFVDGYHDSASDEAVVVLWKEVKNNKGDIYGVTRANKPGNGKVTTQNIDVNTYIPGFPLYFWFRPRENKVISFVFDHSDKGKSNLQCFLEGYLTYRASPWSITSLTKKGASSYERNLKGFSSNGDPAKIDKDIEVQVKLTVSKAGDNLELLLSHQPDITRLQRVEKIKMETSSGVKQSGSESLYQRFFSGLKSNPALPSSIRYKSEVPWKPSEAEVTEVYENALDAVSNGDLLNLTAITRSQKRISFLGNPDREFLEINVPNFTGFIPASALYSAIEDIRSELP